MNFDPMVDPLLLGAIVLAALAGCAVRLVGSRGVFARLRWGARVLLVLAVATMLLRPVIPAEAGAVETTQADVVFVIDTTASISAQDWGEGAPRLDGIRADVTSLVNELAGARFGVITFNSTASVVVPLTTDAASVISAVAVLRTERTAYSAGSSVGIGASAVYDLLRSSAHQEPERARAVFYFGDGEQTLESPPEGFGDSGPLISGGKVFGYGTAAGGPMMVAGGRTATPEPLIDPSTGEPALSRVDEATLDDIAEQLGRPFELRDAAVPATAGAIMASTVSVKGGDVTDVVNEFYWIPAVLASLLLIGELGLTAIAFTRVPRRKRAS